MKAKQYSVKIVEIELENEDEFISFVNQNYTFFHNKLVVIKGKESDTIKRYMDLKNLQYMFNVSLPTQQQTPVNLKEKKNNLKVLDKLIRSGQELKIDGDLLLLNRVNSGGTIIINGTLIITHIVDGSIRCDGDFMMLQTSQKANVVFHGVEVNNKFLKDKLHRVELIDNEIIITPALKETNWV